MCQIAKIDDYIDEWNDYVAYVNDSTMSKLLFAPALYIAYGSYLGLPVSTISDWYKDAEQAYVGYTPEEYIQHKYHLSSSNEDDIWYYVGKEVSEEMLVENNGFWFAF